MPNNLKEMTVDRRLVVCGLDDQWKEAVKTDDKDEMVNILLQVELTEKEARDYARHVSPVRQENVWDILFYLSIAIDIIGTASFSIIRLFMRRDFKNSDFGVFSWIVITTILVAFVYSIAYSIQTNTRKKFRCFIIYPVILFVAIILTLAFLVAD